MPYEIRELEWDTTALPAQAETAFCIYSIWKHHTTGEVRCSATPGNRIYRGDSVVEAKQAAWEDYRQRMLAGLKEVE